MLIAFAQAAETGIDGGALLFMLTSMAAVTALVAWCFYRVLRKPKPVNPGGIESGSSRASRGVEGRESH